MKLRIRPLVASPTNGSLDKDSTAKLSPTKQPNSTPNDTAKQLALIEKLNNAPLTDLGNAECFSLLFGQDLRFCKSRKKWLKWNGHRWVVETDGVANRAAMKVARERKSTSFHIKDDDKRMEALSWAKFSESVARRNAMLNTAMHLKEIETTIDKFDRNPLLAGLKNGTLDLEKGEFRESCREDYISMKFNVEYDPLAKAPRWKQFLQEIFAGDE